MAKDPICGMDVDERNAEAQSEYMGTTYSFCSRGCKETFDADPSSYTSGENADHDHDD